MIIWRGFGFIVLAIPLLFLVLGQYILDTAAGTGTWSANSTYGAISAILLSSVVTWFTGRWLNSESNYHTLFFIPAQFWAFIWIALILALEFILPLV